MSSKKVGFSRMFMVPPSIWELVKKCVNEHEQKLLDNLNKDTSKYENPNETPTSSIIQNISNQDITPIEPNLSIPSNPQIPQDEIDLNLSQTSYHRSKDRSRSFLSRDSSQSFINPNVSQTSRRSRVNVSQVPLPDDSFDVTVNPPINISQHSNKSKLNLTQPSVYSDKSFGKMSLPRDPSPSPEPSIADPGDYTFFRPKRTSSPIDRGVVIPILPLPSCEKRLPRSPVKTRTNTGVLKHQPIAKLPRNDKFICDYCNKHFARKWNLKKHVLTIHRQEVVPDQDQPKSIPSLKRKQQTHFNAPVFKTRKTDNFDRWNL